MIAVLKESTGVTIDTLLQNVRKSIHAGYIGTPAFGRTEKVTSLEQVEEIVETVVDEIESDNDMRWVGLEFAFGDSDAVKSFLLERIKQEVTLMGSPRPKKALAQVCLAIAAGGHERIPLIAMNAGWPEEDVHQIAAGNTDFIAHLKQRHDAAIAECKQNLNERAEEEWYSFHAAD